MKNDDVLLVERIAEDTFNIEAGRHNLHERLVRTTYTSPALAGGDLDAQWEMAESTGDETACGSMSTPDQNVIEELGAAMGIHYFLGEELRCVDKERARDAHRWELDPASSEDYVERMRELNVRRRRSGFTEWMDEHSPR